MKKHPACEVWPGVGTQRVVKTYNVHDGQFCVNLARPLYTDIWLNINLYLHIDDIGI